jgi:signal transduction histidine kinase
MLADQLTERVQQPRDVAEPFGELAAIDVDTLACIDLGLPVERQVIAELGDGDVREDACIHHAARNGQLRHRRLHHRLALAARAGGTNVAGGRLIVALNAPTVRGSVTLRVRDQGPGLPEGFSLDRAQTLGMKIIRALVERMGAHLTIHHQQPGAEFVAEIPVTPPRATRDSAQQ